MAWDAISSVSNRLWDWLGEGGWEVVKEVREGKRVVLVFGCEGTGKTSLINSLATYGAATDKIELEHRTSTSIRAILSIHGMRFRVVDTPGLQEEIETTVNENVLPLQVRDQGLLDRVARVGIINVVSYGYHEYSAEAREKFVTLVRSADPEALEKHREKEISAVQEWVSKIAKTQAKIDWVITAVNKADLWPEEWERVRDHYVKGEYRRAIEKGIGRNTKLATARYCSIFKKFYDTVPMSGLLEDERRDKINAEFLRVLVDMAAPKPVR